MPINDPHASDIKIPSTTLWLPPLSPKEQQRIDRAHRRQHRPKLGELSGFKGKTIWDYLNLLAILAIPILIAAGTLWYTSQQTQATAAASAQQHQTDQEIAQQAHYDNLIQVYRDGIDQLLIENGLRTSTSDSDVQRIAHSRTLDVLRQIDNQRKGLVINYLSDLGLVQGGTFDSQQRWHPHPSLISLSGADLSGADLSRTDLWQANLSRATLIEANLYEADLSGVNLIEATLSGADLSGADLSVAYLSGADLSGINLSGVNLNGADLSGTTMPDGSRHSCEQGEEFYCLALQGAKLKMTLISGRILCSGGEQVVGVWVDVENGGSGFAEWYKTNASGSEAAFRYTLPADRYYNLHVGCGGTSQDWRVLDSTETGTGNVKDDSFHYFVCEDIPYSLDYGKCLLKK